MARDKFYEVKRVSVSSLLLDTYNPRIRHGQDQNDCIARILRDRENFLNLLKDIAANGLSPEHILISKNPARKWIVRDGNRRVTALKLLNRPNLAQPDTALVALITRIHDTHAGTVPTKLTCLACDDEEAISAYLERKHTGVNAGVGQKPWSSLLKSLFNLHAGLSDPNRRAAQLVLWAEENGMRIDDEFPLTTLVRGLNADTLKLIGFAIENDEIVATISVDKAYAMVEHLISDIAHSRVNVKRDGEEGSIITKAAQLKYFRTLRDAFADQPDGPPPQVRQAPNQAPVGNQDSQGNTNTNNQGRPAGNGTEAETAEPLSRRQASPAKPSWDRPCLFGRRSNASPGIEIPGSEPKAISVIAELRRLDPNKTPIATAMLMRYLFELSNEHYRHANDLRINPQESLHRSIANSSEHMKTSGLLTAGQHDLIMRYTREEDSMLHIKTLQAYIHRPNFHPNGQALNTFWDEIGCFVSACWHQQIPE